MAIDNPFVYDKFVTGKNFIGRRDDCIILENFLWQGEHVALWGPPKSGKMSVIQQTLFNMRIAGKRFLVGQFSLLNIRSAASFFIRLGSTAMRTVAQTPAEYADIVATHLGGTHFVFDPGRYSAQDELVSLNWDLDEGDMAAMIRLPFALAQAAGQKMILIIDEFERLDSLPEGERIFKVMESVIKAQRGAETGCCFIFCGSMNNAMTDIFEERHFFYRLVEKFRLRPVEEKEIIEYVVRGFLSSGKVVERELLLGMCRLFRNNLWYINHFISICDSFSKGYIVESTLMDSLSCMLAIHEPRFLSTMASLTAFQVNFLQAVLEGNTKFTSAEVRQKYNLNSSANVKRLRDALVKKEIITFNDREEPEVMDPLFEYWVRKYYYEI